MRKQVDYEFRLLKVSATDPTASREMLRNMVKGYLDSGWELFKTETVHYEGNDAFVAFHFLKYEDEPVSDAGSVGALVDEPATRGRKKLVAEKY